MSNEAIIPQWIHDEEVGKPMSNDEGSKQDASLIEEVRRLTYELNGDIARQEREQCCKDICECCKLGYPIALESTGHWRHTGPDGYRRLCEARKIRERAWKESKSR